MHPQRRTVLRLLAAGAGLGTAGCLGSAREDGDTVGRRGQPRSEGDSLDGLADRAGADRIAAGEDDAEAQTAQDNPADGEELTEEEARIVEATDDVMDELAWFAADYPDALEAYLEAGEEAIEAIREVGASVPLSERDADRLDGEIDRPRIDRGWPYDVWWEDGDPIWRRTSIEWQRPDEDNRDAIPLDDGDVDRLREVTGAFADTFEDVFEPHFWGAESERRFAGDTIDEIARFNELRDTSMVVAGLVRLIRRYVERTSGKYISENLSDDPIRNRLNEYLEAPNASDADFPPLFEVEYRGRAAHDAFVYSGDRVGEARESELLEADPLNSIDGSTDTPGQLTLQDAVEAIEVEEGRIDRAYVISNVWRRQAGKYYSEDLQSETVFVQRYEGIEAGRAAIEELKDRFRVGIHDAAGNDWVPLTFPCEGETWYAQLRRAGHHLLVRGAAKRPLEHRHDAIIDEAWTEPLRLAWVWDEE